MIETIATLVAIAATVGGTLFAFSRGIWIALIKLDRRFDELDEAIQKISHRQDLERSACQGQINELNYKVETQIEYGVNANRELIQHRTRRLETAIASLSGALERVSDGRYVPRSEGWPTDDPPTEFRTKGKK